MTTTQPRITDAVRDRLGPPLVLVGGFFRMCVLTGKALFRPPFQWREFILQCWFIMRVAILPTMAVSVPVTVLFIFTFNILLIQVGAAETLLDDSVVLARKAGAADVLVDLQIWPEMIHIWHIFFPMLSAGRRAIASGGTFVRNAIRGE